MQQLFIKRFGMHRNKTGILLSGGMDSIAIAYWKRPDMAFTIDYGQNCAQSEIEASSYVAQELGIDHHIIRLDCSSLGSGTLCGKIALTDSPTEEWWPYRNQLLVTLACMKGYGLGLKVLYVGSIMQDSLRHKDGTKEFYNKLSSVIEYQEGGIKVEMPAYNMNTIDLIKAYGVPVKLLLHSFSCHVSNHACAKCSGCYKNYEIRKMIGIG